MPTWREYFRGDIAKVIEETGFEDMRLLRKKLREAFKENETEYGGNWQKKAWNAEAKAQIWEKYSSKLPENQATTEDLELFQCMQENHLDLEQKQNLEWELGNYEQSRIYSWNQKRTDAENLAKVQS